MSSRCTGLASMPACPLGDSRTAGRVAFWVGEGRVAGSGASAGSATPSWLGQGLAVGLGTPSTGLLVRLKSPFTPTSRAPRSRRALCEASSRPAFTCRPLAESQGPRRVQTPRPGGCVCLFRPKSLSGKETRPSPRPRVPPSAPRGFDATACVQTLLRPPSPSSTASPCLGLLTRGMGP